MGKLRVRVKEKRLLVDPDTGYTIDFAPKGKVIDDVPDNGFWRIKCNEGYLELLGEVSDSPYKGLNVTELKNLAKDHDIELPEKADKKTIIAMLEEAGVTP